MKRRTKEELKKEFKILKKTEKQLNKELMNFIIHKKKKPEEVRAILRACFEKRIYEKTKKLH